MTSLLAKPATQLDENRRVLDFTDPEPSTWGVNGLWETAIGFGPSDRHEYWEANVEADKMPHAVAIEVEHSHAGRNRLLEILSWAKSVAASAADTVAEIRRAAGQ